MSGFEVLFSFYGLLLGLAVANVTSSFADTWRRRGNWKMGIAPPLLGLLILLAAAQQWSSFWGGRDVLTMGPWEVLTAMGMALPYIFVSHAMFPADLQEGGSLEEHYMQQSPILLGALLAPPLVSLTYNLLNSPPAPLYRLHRVYLGCLWPADNNSSRAAALAEPMGSSGRHGTALHMDAPQAFRVRWRSAFHPQRTSAPTAE